MTGKKFGIVHPPLGSFPSGGNVYNEKLLEYAGRCCPALVSLTWPDSIPPAGHWDVLVWDSLLLHQLERVAGERIGLLLHYLPSLDPTLTGDQRLAARAVEERAAAIADFAVTTGSALAAAVRARWPGKPVFVCEPGVGDAFLRKTARSAGESVALLTVAHLLPAKGHAPLLQILQRLRHLPWHWHIVGQCDPSCEAARRVRELAIHAGLTDRISFHGALRQDDVAALMTGSDLLVCASTFESYGMVVAEAAAVCLPVLSFRVGAAEQLIQHRVTGLLAAAGDWATFGRYLQTLLQDPPLRAALQRNLRAAPVRNWSTTLTDFVAACATISR